MGHNVNLSNEYAQAEAAAGGALANGGYLRIYDGAQPATADTAIGAQHLLAELRFGNPAGVAADEVFTFNAITGEDSALFDGTATWYRAFKSNGTSPLRDGTVGATGSGSDIELDNTGIVVGAEVYVDSLIWRVVK
jgi:hypothetical protein